MEIVRYLLILIINLPKTGAVNIFVYSFLPMIAWDYG